MCHSVLRTACVLTAALAASVVVARADDERPGPAPTPAAAPAAEPAAPKDAAFDGAWEIRIERPDWQPEIVPGCLTVFRTKGGVRATLRMDGIGSWDGLATDVVWDGWKDGALRFTAPISPETPVRFVATSIGDGGFSGICTWEGPQGNYPTFFSAVRVPPVRFEPAILDRVSVQSKPPAPFPVERDPAAVGVDPAALDRLILYASRCDTDALVVVKDGKLICDRTFGRPRELCTTQSVTKAIASFAIPLLVEEGKIAKNLDEPLTWWFPQWKDDARKSKITLRQVLTHTTGLASDGTAEMQEKPDCLAYALASPAVDEPGTRWAYNNQAMELLSGIVAKSAGEPCNVYLRKRLFEPLGAKRWTWFPDGAGNIPTFGGINIDAIDLARIGWMVACRGAWDGRQVIPAWWFDTITEPSPLKSDLGIVWWLRRDERRERITTTEAWIERLRAGGVADAEKLRPLVGKAFDGRAAWWTAARQALGDEVATQIYTRAGKQPAGDVSGPLSCIYHTGSNGQSLVVYPESRMVIVRQRRSFAYDELPQHLLERTDFSEIFALARSLVPDAAK